MVTKPTQFARPSAKETETPWSNSRQQEPSIQTSSGFFWALGSMRRHGSQVHAASPAQRLFLGLPRGKHCLQSPSAPSGATQIQGTTVGFTVGCQWLEPLPHLSWFQVNLPGSGRTLAREGPLQGGRKHFCHLRRRMEAESQKIKLI